MISKKITENTPTQAETDKIDRVELSTSNAAFIKLFPSGYENFGIAFYTTKMHFCKSEIFSYSV